MIYIKGKKNCYNNHINDRVLYMVLVEVFNAMVENKYYFIEKWKEGLQGGNVLIRYKVKQSIRIIDKAKSIKNFMRIYFWGIQEKCR
ncbi:recombinase [Clostridium sp. WILCCON 0269]|uniref:Recombinase n=1 Tax=Candidatus Clostridium eludens TaxID=3381663 RepID=A0ABW8SK45_9CLOT